MSWTRRSTDGRTRDSEDGGGSIAEVAVVGMPDAEWGESVVAFVVMASGAQTTTEALDQHCLAQMARFKRPKRYELVTELPKNNYGKVLKTELRQRLASAAG